MLTTWRSSFSHAALRLWRIGDDRKKARKHFFFEKKKEKTFVL